MTPEQIKKEQNPSEENKAKVIPVRQSNEADLEETLVQQDLKTSKPIDKTPPKESSRQYGKKVGDLRKVYEIAKEKGVDIDNIGTMPLMDADKGKITEAVQGAYGRELAGGIKSISDSITAPVNEERNKLDLKKLMENQKRIRRARLADALQAFGEGLQGRTIDPEQFASTRLVRQRDKEFQDYKDVTERNQKTKYLYETQTRKELVDWADEQAKNERLDANTRAKFKQVADKYAADADYKNEQLKIARERNRIAATKKGKEDKPVIIKTAKKTYELKPEDADFYRSEILKNAEILEEKYPGWFTVTQSSKEDRLTRKPILGPKTYKLNPDVKDTDIIREFLVEEENRKQHEANGYSQFEKSKNNLLKIYEERGDLNEQPKQASKSDPLELFSVKDAPRTQPQKQTTQKSQYSTGGLY